MLQTVTEEARYAMHVGRENHYRFRVVGAGGMINEPVFKNGWWYCPEFTTPSEVLGIVGELEKSGVKIQGFIVAHETTNFLPAPKEQIRPKVQVPSQTSQSQIAGVQLPVDIDTVIEVTLKVVGLILLAPLMLFGLVLDPEIIVVLEDGSWISVMSWLE